MSVNLSYTRTHQIFNDQSKFREPFACKRKQKQNSVLVAERNAAGLLRGLTFIYVLFARVDRRNQNFFLPRDHAVSTS